MGEEAFLFGGLLTGLAVGYVREGEWVGLKRAGNVETGVLRVALGLPSVGGLALLGVRLVDPVLVLPFFFALGLVVALVLPWAFARLEAIWLRQGL